MTCQFSQQWWRRKNASKTIRQKLSFSFSVSWRITESPIPNLVSGTHLQLILEPCLIGSFLMCYGIMLATSVAFLGNFWKPIIKLISMQACSFYRLVMHTLSVSIFRCCRNSSISITFSNTVRRLYEGSIRSNASPLYLHWFWMLMLLNVFPFRWFSFLQNRIHLNQHYRE